MLENKNKRTGRGSAPPMKSMILYFYQLKTIYDVCKKSDQKLYFFQYWRFVLKLANFWKSVWLGEFSRFWGLVYFANVFFIVEVHQQFGFFFSWGGVYFSFVYVAHTVSMTYSSKHESNLFSFDMWVQIHRVAIDFFINLISHVEYRL